MARRSRCRCGRREPADPSRASGTWRGSGSCTASPPRLGSRRRAPARARRSGRTRRPACGRCPTVPARGRDGSAGATGPARGRAGRSVGTAQEAPWIESLCIDGLCFKPARATDQPNVSELRAPRHPTRQVNYGHVPAPPIPGFPYVGSTGRAACELNARPVALLLARDLDHTTRCRWSRHATAGGACGAGARRCSAPCEA